MERNNKPTSDQDVQSIEIESDVTEQYVHLQSDRLKASSVVVATFAVLAVLFISYVIYRSLIILLLLFLALLVATAIEPLVNKLRRGPLNRTTGILIVYSGLFLMIGALGYLMFSVFVSQLGDFGASLNRTVGELRADANDIESPFIKQQAIFFLDAAGTQVAGFERPEDPNAVPETEKVETVARTTTILAELLFAFTTIFVVAFYWLSERTLIKRGLMSWFPAKRANRIRRVWDDIEVKVGGWVRGQLTLMAIIGVISAVGYFFIGLDYWPALALIIAIAEAIPLVGPYIGTAPAILVALTQPNGVSKAFAVVIFAIVLQTVEGNVLVPRVMKNSVGISPLTVIVSIIIGATLAGLAGALVAVPLAGAIQVIVADIKAARDDEKKFEDATEEARQTREEDGELVVAYPEDGKTRTTLEAGSRAEPEPKIATNQ